jgi:hypothetical protein
MNQPSTVELRTSITLDVVADGMPWEQFRTRILAFQVLDGVEQVTMLQHSNPILFPTAHWATVAVTIHGVNKARLRRLYHTVTKHTATLGLRMTRRGCILTDLYD